MLKSMLIVPPAADAVILAVSIIVLISAVASVALPAMKLPDASRATIAETVFASVAVVAELDTFPAVEIVASFVSTIAAAELMSALTILSLAIWTIPVESIVTSPETVVAVGTPPEL